MKKFDRLPPEQRKEEIQQAALKLFNEKGFASTTMENIVEQVSLSKGGVYRLYSSTSAILADLMIRGMRLRNAYYEHCVSELRTSGGTLSLNSLVEIIGDSMLLYPDISRVYVEFLWEKQRNPELQQLYERVCEESLRETVQLIEKAAPDNKLLHDRKLLSRLTELMNSCILSLTVLDIREQYNRNRKQIYESISRILKKEN